VELNRSSPIPLYTQIEQTIRDWIASGEFGPGDRVPSEIELAGSMSVSRMTVRKAIDRLVSDRVLFRRAGKGTFVAQPKIAHGLSTQLSFSAGMKALGLPVVTQVLAASMVGAPPMPARAFGSSEGSPVVFLRRLRTVAGQPAAIHTSYLPASLSHILDTDLTGSLTDAMEALGAGVADAVDYVESVVASGEEADILEIQKGEPLLRIEGQAYSASREPLRYTDALFRGDIFRFSVDTTMPSDLRVVFRSPDPDNHATSTPGGES